MALTEARSVIMKMQFIFEGPKAYNLAKIMVMLFKTESIIIWGKSKVAVFFTFFHDYGNLAELVYRQTEQGNQIIEKGSSWGISALIKDFAAASKRTDIERLERPNIYRTIKRQN